MFSLQSMRHTAKAASLEWAQNDPFRVLDWIFLTSPWSKFHHGSKSEASFARENGSDTEVQQDELKKTHPKNKNNCTSKSFLKVGILYIGLHFHFRIKVETFIFCDAIAPERKWVFYISKASPTTNIAARSFCTIFSYCHKQLLLFDEERKISYSKHRKKIMIVFSLFFFDCATGTLND